MKKIVPVLLMIETLMLLVTLVLGYFLLVRKMWKQRFIGSHRQMEVKQW